MPLLVAFLVQQELVVGIHETSMQVSVCAQREMQESRVNVEAAPSGWMSEYMLSLKQAIW